MIPGILGIENELICYGPCLGRKGPVASLFAAHPDPLAALCAALPNKVTPITQPQDGPESLTQIGEDVKNETPNHLHVFRKRTEQRGSGQ